MHMRREELGSMKWNLPNPAFSLDGQGVGELCTYNYLREVTTNALAMVRSLRMSEEGRCYARNYFRPHDN
jgi:hypothetical protein